jgi:hypothetical protein
VLAVHDTGAVGFGPPGADELLEHRRFGLLGLADQWGTFVTAQHQQDPRSGADADDLAGDVRQAEVLQPSVPMVSTDRADRKSFESVVVDSAT